MKILLRFLNFLCSRIPFIKTKAPVDDNLSIHSRLQTGEHNCALVALAKVMPDLSPDQIIQGFSDCCYRWPYGGVTNKEFNITLRYLGLYNKFEYDGSDEMMLDNFLVRSKRKDVFILLLHGHFTVVKYGKVHDNSFYANLGDAKVYCSWRLISD